jgi:hypothetical protein
VSAIPFAHQPCECINLTRSVPTARYPWLALRPALRPPITGGPSYA